MEKGSESRLLPKFPRQPGDTNPLINMGDGRGVRVAKGNPRREDQIKTFHKPRPVNPDIITISNSREFQKKPAIPKINIINWPLNMFPVQLCFGDNER